MSDDAAFWDNRYAPADYQFGTAPNDYLRSQCWRLRRGAALCAGDGEGRNGVFLAEQGHDVLSVDLSATGLRKAAALAAQRGVALRTQVANLGSWAWPVDRFDLIAWIFCSMPAQERKAAAAGAVRALAPGGLLVFEGFTPAQLAHRSGGPKDVALLWTPAMLLADFAGLQVLELLEGRVLLDEGPRHQGEAAVLRAVLRRPI